MWSAAAGRRFVTPRLAGARAAGAQKRARPASVRRVARTAMGAPYESESELSHSIRGEEKVNRNITQSRN